VDYLLNFLKIQFWIRVNPVCQLNDEVKLDPKSTPTIKRLSTVMKIIIITITLIKIAVVVVVIYIFLY